MTTFKVLIAEDEPVFAQYIKQTLESDNELEVVACCRSGEEAYENIVNLNPHILITDIRMQEMNGLQLAEKAKNYNPKILIVIISGYNLFDYAREAIRLGIEDYILKPVDGEELLQTVKSLKESLEIQIRDERNSVLTSIFRNSAFGSLYNFIGSKSCNLLLVYQSGEPELTLEYCSSALNELEINNISVATYRGIVVYIEPHDSTIASNLTRIKDWLISHREINTISILLSENCDIDESFEDLLKQMRIELRGLTTLGKAKFKTMEGKTDSKDTSVLINDLTAKTALQLSNPAQAQRVWNSLFEKWENEEQTSRQIKKNIYTIIEQIHKTDATIIFASDINERIAECFKYSDSYTEARDRVWETIKDTIFREKPTSDSKIDLVELYKNVAAYVLANMDKNIPLQEISNRFHVSQPYISKAFRLYTGLSYKEYCLDKKIKLAMAIIEEKPDIVIKEVAEKVGIEQMYFSTVFYRMTGMYPSQYKTFVIGNIQMTMQ